ncbi:MAG: hypothetical protein ACKVOR_02520 [Flavobacteriales bacterium]
MKSIKEQTFRLLLEASLVEREVLTDKLALLIERYRDNPEKSSEMAETIMRFFESISKEQTDGTTPSQTAATASKEDVGLVLLEIQRLRKELADLKQTKGDV